MQWCAFCVFTGILNPNQPETRINLKKNQSHKPFHYSRPHNTNKKHPKLTLKTEYFIIIICTIVPIYNSILLFRLKLNPNNYKV